VTGNETVGGTLDVTGASTLTGNVGIGGASGSEKLLVTGAGRITGNLDVSGDLTVTGNFNFSEVIQNITTVNNEVIISTQLDISNQGTGPALKVSQFGVGDDQDVALFNAGDEGDAFKIDSSGNSHFYKEVNIVKLKVEGGNTELGGDLSVSGTTTTSTLNTSTIDSSGRVDIGTADGQSQGLVLTGTEPTITLKDTNGRSGMIHMNDNNMFFLSGASNSEAWSKVGDRWPLVLHTDTNRAEFGGQLDCDLDAFHYSAGVVRIDRGTYADVSWTLKKRGSDIQNGDSFRPKYTGKYSITLCLFFGSDSSGPARVALKRNGLEYDLNGGGGTFLVSADDANRDVNMFTGNIIVDAVAGQDIKAFVKIGTLKYYGAHSYLAGYYIGNT
jgi:hypothetical protein